jgi:anti-anti-sigma factor
VANSIDNDARLWWTATERDCVAHLAGEIDLANAGELFAAIRAGRRDSTGLAVDLSNVTFLDSTGIAEIVRLARETQLRVVSPPGSEPRRVLLITGVDSVVVVLDTVDALLAQ